MIIIVTRFPVLRTRNVEQHLYYCFPLFPILAFFPPVICMPNSSKIFSHVFIPYVREDPFQLFSDLPLAPLPVIVLGHDMIKTRWLSCIAVILVAGQQFNNFMINFLSAWTAADSNLIRCIQSPCCEVLLFYKKCVRTECEICELSVNVSELTLKAQILDTIMTLVKLLSMGSHNCKSTHVAIQVIRVCTCVHFNLIIRLWRESCKG